MEAAGFRALSAITSSYTFRAHPLLHLPFSSARMFPSSISSSRLYQLSFSSKRFRVNALHDGVSRVAVESVENKFLQVVLVSPQIPGNTGCIARTCAASAVKLHLVEPLGFQVDDAKLKRAGLDYWPFVVVKVHSSWSEFREYFKQEDGEKRLLAFTKRGTYIHSLHSKGRNRLAHKRLNDLVFIKYNRALKRQYDLRDKIDPISLDDIDDINEWLMGGLDDEENNLVFEDDDLTWGDVGRASGVGEHIYSFRSRASSSSNELRASTSKTNRKRPISHILDEEEDEIDVDQESDEDQEEYKSESSGDSDDLIEEDELDLDD